MRKGQPMQRERSNPGDNEASPEERKEQLKGETTTAIEERGVDFLLADLRWACTNHGSIGIEKYILIVAGVESYNLVHTHGYGKVK